jgi:hypothetical protein
MSIAKFTFVWKLIPPVPTPPSELTAQLTFGGQQQQSLSMLRDSNGRVKIESDQVILQDEA